MEQRDFVKSILQHPLIRNHCRIEEYKRNIIVKTPRNPNYGDWNCAQGLS